MFEQLLDKIYKTVNKLEEQREYHLWGVKYDHYYLNYLHKMGFQYANHTDLERVGKELHDHQDPPKKILKDFKGFDYPYYPYFKLMDKIDNVLASTTEKNKKEVDIDKIHYIDRMFVDTVRLLSFEEQTRLKYFNFVYIKGGDKNTEDVVRVLEELREELRNDPEPSETIIYDTKGNSTVVYTLEIIIDEFQLALNTEFTGNFSYSDYLL